MATSQQIELSLRCGACHEESVMPKKVDGGKEWGGYQCKRCKGINKIVYERDTLVVIEEDMSKSF